MNAGRILLTLAIAALFAGLFIGFGGVFQRHSVEGTSLWCGNLLMPENRYEGYYGGLSDETQALLDGDCEIVRATKNSWAVVLITTGVAVLVGSARVRRTPDRGRPDKLT